MEIEDMAVTRGKSSQCLAAPHIETGYTATAIRTTCHQLRSKEKDEAADQSSTHTWPPDLTRNCHCDPMGFISYLLLQHILTNVVA